MSAWRRSRRTVAKATSSPPASRISRRRSWRPRTHAAVAGGRRERSSATRDADQPSALLGGDQYPYRRSQRLTQIEDAAFPLPAFVDDIGRRRLPTLLPPPVHVDFEGPSL